MAFTIELSPESERLLAEQAARRGITPEQLATEFLRNALGLIGPSAASPTPAAGPTAAKPLSELFEDWAAEEAANGPTDPAQAEREWSEFRDAMNANSTRGHSIYP